MPSEGKEITIEIPSSPWLILTVVMLLLITYFDLQVTFKTPIVFGDEGFHTTLAKWIAQHRSYPDYIPFEQTKLIKHGFYRPPLWNLLEASFYLFFGFHESIVKFLTPFITFLLGLAVFALVRRLYSEEVAFAASVLSVAFPSVVTYSVLFYYSNLLLFLSTLAFLSLLVYAKERNRKFLLLFAVFSALAFLTNRVALGLYALGFVYFLYDIVKNKNHIKNWYLPIALALIIPLGFFVRNYLVFKTPICESVPYLGRFFDTSLCDINNFHAQKHYKGQAIPIGSESSTFGMGLDNYVNFAYGNHWFVLFGLFSGLVLLYYKRDKLLIPIVVYFLLLAILFPAVSHRAEDTARYTLMWSSSFALVIAIFYSEVYKFFESYKKHLGVIVVLLILAFAYFSAKGKSEVMLRVKSWPSTFFQACSWIATHTPKNATVYTIWSHNAAYCSERNIAQASDLPDVALSYNATYIAKVLKENGVDYLWIQKFSIDPLNREYLDNYPAKFVKLLIDNPKYFIKVYENGPSVEQCLQGGCTGSVIFKFNETAV